MENLRKRYIRASFAERNLWSVAALTVIVVLQLCALFAINS
ncbi:hypothetical protein [Sphingobacterium paludis]|uniref:Uncharacterized protein n=1 Tax=Sphingobacterium paludis TaxID=1476465 RepID=A0A4R7CZJ6_9SPHI|nr:hypothetical protein [Sphingobacterium paludis]TDS13810.1 hypothetical protein B0I21_104136 [Sphingobacterium paludis]